MSEATKQVKNLAPGDHIIFDHVNRTVEDLVQVDDAEFMVLFRGDDEAYLLEPDERLEVVASVRESLSRALRTLRKAQINSKDTRSQKLFSRGTKIVRGLIRNRNL